MIGGRTPFKSSSEIHREPVRDRSVSPTFIRCSSFSGSMADRVMRALRGDRVRFYFPIKQSELGRGRPFPDLIQLQT
jgi:hypothetical protein